MLFLLVDLIRVHRLLPSPLHRDGPGDWQRRAGVPLDEVAQLRASAADKAAADKAAAGRANSLKKTTIICVKGKLTKKVTAVTPKCPKGYKKK